MGDEISKLKHEIVTSKSLGQQLDGCKSAIERFQKRRQQAQAQLETATHAIEKETLEISRLEFELKKVEESIASQQEVPPVSVCPMDTLVATMQELLASLQRPETIDKEFIANKLVQVIALSKPTPAESGHAQTLERMETDTPPPPTPCATYGHRLLSKTGKCARTAPYNLPRPRSFAHPTSFTPLGEQGQQL